MDALPTPRPATQSRHVRFRPRFIKEDELGRIKAGLLPPPRPPGFADVGAVLFAGAECLFLYVSPSLAST